MALQTTTRLVWLLVTVVLVAAPSPAVADDEANFLQALTDGSDAARLNAAKWLRQHTGLLSGDDAEAWHAAARANLVHDDAEVRRWMALAVAAAGETGLPLLREALEVETDEKVVNQLEASVRHIEDAAEERAWIANHPCQAHTDRKVLKWEVRELCDPLDHYPPILRDLGDGTSLYGSHDRTDETCFRGKRKERCLVKCLPSLTLIASPDGPRPVAELAVGDLVYTVDRAGERAVEPIVALGAPSVVGHAVVAITLDDGRQVTASAGHPTVDGRDFGSLRTGDALDGARVAHVHTLAYDGARTYDLLPAGETGAYWADGVLIGSTLGGGAAVSTR